MKKFRIDQLLIEHGKAETVEMARRMVMAGEVFVREQRVQKSSDSFTKDIDIEIRRQQFVGRGGDKLDGALKDFCLGEELTGKTVLDIGASTGGFTDCVLQHGAGVVYAVDVGHGHLDWSLRNSEKVRVYERVGIQEFAKTNEAKFDLIVGDISFNSISRLLPAILQCCLREKTTVVVLIKPQFELPKDLVRNGIVTDPELQKRALESVKEELELAGCTVHGISPSRLKGRSGNQEYFCHFTVTSTDESHKAYLKSRLGV